MREEELETAIKVVIVGDGAVGKSSMIQRYCKGLFTKDYKKTIGVDFLERLIDVDAEDVRLMLWDTAGQEEFDAITKAYYRGAQACVVAFSLTDRKSFLAVESWLRKVEDEIDQGIPTAIVLNKMDMEGSGREQVSAFEADALASRLRLPLYRTSVKSNSNVDAVFEFLARKYIQEINGEYDAEPSPSPRFSPQRDPWNQPQTTTMATTTANGGGGGSNALVGIGAAEDSFMRSEGPSSSSSTQKRHRWRIGKKKKNNLTSSASLGGGGTIVLAPSKRRTNGKKDLTLSNCSVL